MIINKLIGQETPEGDGVVVTRLFPTHQIMNHDPFVLFDHFTLKEGTGFPNHPHRGFEAITYVFEGGMNHKDNLGNNKFVSQGGAQVFCAGRGLIHSEMPARKGITSGIQLWINLAKKEKAKNPTYQHFEKGDLPTYIKDGIEITEIVGKESPVVISTEVIYRFIKFSKPTSFPIKVDSASNAIIYILSGVLEIENQETCNKEWLLIKADEGETIHIRAKTSGQVIFCLGRPHGEPIYQHGPYVD